MNPNTKTQPIDKFDGDYSFLSNFYGVPVTYNGIRYLNNEAAFQAQKDPERALEFANLPPNKAKRLGRRVTMRPDWDKVKDQIMYELNKQKFAQPHMRNMLLATGERELIEGNYWNDRYWGVCDGTGQNKLGKILMRVRSEL